VSGGLEQMFDLPPSVCRGHPVAGVPIFWIFILRPCEPVSRLFVVPRCIGAGRNSRGLGGRLRRGVFDGEGRGFTLRNW